jgi:hypothetical protein
MRKYLCWNLEAITVFLLDRVRSKCKAYKLYNLKINYVFACKDVKFNKDSSFFDPPTRDVKFNEDSSLFDPHTFTYIVSYELVGDVNDDDLIASNGDNSMDGANPIDSTSTHSNSSV